jgi:hypothetical protein
LGTRQEHRLLRVLVPRHAESSASVRWDVASPHTGVESPSNEAVLDGDGLGARDLALGAGLLQALDPVDDVVTGDGHQWQSAEEVVHVAPDVARYFSVVVRSTPVRWST